MSEPERWSYAEAGRKCPFPKSEDSIRRWVTKGLRGEKLAVKWCGGTPYITPEALTDFLERVTAVRRAK
jgi:hypothetical protein